MEPAVISIHGARVHNLRDVSVDLPRNKLICFTGVSGSGKSSLAFDTIYAEGQRRYIESLSSYARQFLGQFTKPDVDQITGLSPAIAIQQKTGSWNPRSTVGTITQIHDFMRVLWARVGVQHCPDSGVPIAAQSREAIIGRIEALESGTRFLVLAPVVIGQKGAHKDLLEDMRRRGFVRARVDGAVISLSEDAKLDRNRRHDIEIVVDRLTAARGWRSRLAEAVDSALELGKGTLIIAPADATSKGEGDVVLSSQYASPVTGKSFAPPTPQLLSFNSPVGMCPACDGIGTAYEFDPELLVPEPTLNFWHPCIEPMRTTPGRWRRHLYEGVAKHLKVDLNKPWKSLPATVREAILYGTGDAHITYEWRHSGGVWRHGGEFEGIIAELTSKYRKAKAGFVRKYYEKYMRMRACSACGGARLNEQARAVRLGGKGIHEVAALSVQDVLAFFETLKLSKTEAAIAGELLKEIRGRLAFLCDVGLGYLTLDRTAPTLSGGEAQRIRLAGQIGCGLVGVLYVLDEPSIGLHPRDNRQLLASLVRLRDMGNTVVVVEHDEDTMRAADVIIDFGPGPGVRGGHVVAKGLMEDLMACEESVTGRYLAGRDGIAVPKRRPIVAEGTKARRGERKARRHVGTKGKTATTRRRRK